MQTFLPLPKFSESAAVLDRARLGKQRVETLQIMTALVTGTGWVHHPATQMWRGYEWALLNYQKAICAEWNRRGYSDTCFHKTFLLFFAHTPARGERNSLPPWFGDSKFHLSHQSNLIRKDPDFYAGVFPGVKPDLPYIWPEGKGLYD